jgi:hypothetical protein
MKRSDELLLLIEEHSSPYDGRVWVPSAYPQRITLLGKETLVYGAGDRSALNALLRRNLIVHTGLGTDRYAEAYAITEDGLLRAHTLA